MNTDIDTAKFIAELTAAGTKPIVIGNSTQLLAPEGWSVNNIDELIEKAQLVPSRKKGTFTALDLDSLIAHAEDQGAQAHGYILCNPDKCSVTAIYNHDKLGTGWKDHRAYFIAEKTPEFQRWINNNGKQFGQTEFAEFIEDNLADVPGEDGPLLLNMATTISASTAINFSSAKRLQDGQVQLVYNEVIDAKAGADGSLKIPQVFDIGVRIFKNGSGYKIRARLKYRLHSGTVKFWYELDRPERAIEDAFNDYVTQLREKTTYSVLLGAV
jgi:uncharacterized protein YfdQ (DUF2303 family)